MKTIRFTIILFSMFLSITSMAQLSMNSAGKLTFGRQDYRFGDVAIFGKPNTPVFSVMSEEMVNGGDVMRSLVKNPHSIAFAVWDISGSWDKVFHVKGNGEVWSSTHFITSDESAKENLST